ncbi:MAG: hypothetical protein ABSF98_22775 [Bryobacteraceae bacterium]|jgi:hypothetical protein
MRMPFFYQSGEEIRKGDRVLYDGEPGEIEFVADPANDPDDWYVTEYGGGVMVIEPKHFGLLFLTTTQDEEDLEFVSRTS